MEEAIKAKAIWAIEYGIAKDLEGLVDAGNKILMMLSWQGNHLDEIIRSENYKMVLRVYYKV